MASIRIFRNESGNCINFYGASNPTYWNACLSGQVDVELVDTVNVVNDIITAQTGKTVYEFYRIPFTEFTDADGNSFTTAQECADYITEKANVTGLSGDGIDLIGQNVCFHLDHTSTSVVLDNGYHYGVNTIKAVEGNGNISIISIDTNNSITHFFNLEVGNACVNDETVPGGLNDVINVLNELFTVGAFQSVVISDPFSTLVANVNGEASGYTLEGSTAIDPVGDSVFSNSSSGNLAGLKSVATINRAGEYFTFDIRGEGQIGFGLIHTQESYDNNFYSGNSLYADPTTFAITNSAHYGFQFSHWFHPTPDGSWTNYGANTSYVQGPAWHNSNVEFEARDEWLAGDPIKMRVGLDVNGYISIESLKDDGVTWVVHSRTSYHASEGAEFHLGIKIANSSVSVYSAPKVHLLDTVKTPTTLGTDAITVFGEGITGTLAGGIASSATDNFDNDGFVTSQTINASGEYFEFTWSAGADANFGLFSENNNDVSDLTSDTTLWANDDYIFYGARLESNGTINSSFSENNLPDTAIGNGNDISVSQYYGRIGFDGQGRATIWYSTDGVTYTVYRHTQAAAPSGDYKFIWIAQEQGAIFDTLLQGVIDTAPTMNFRYIESPDGYYNYPLFNTQEEADYYELITSGSDNGSHTHVYPDDPTFTTWYMPNTSFQMSYPLTPIQDGVTTFNGNPIIWTEITSLTNTELAPPAFIDTTITVNELSAVNYQLTPQDVGYVTTIGGIPNWTITDGHTLQGTAPEVTGDNVTNPSDTTTVTVYRTNSYGTSQGTLTINIINLTAPVITAITGFTHNASSTVLVDENIMGDGSVVGMDESLLDIERLVILKSYVESNILPSLQQLGDKYYMGILNSGADVSTVEDSDWDVAFVWEYETASTHLYRVIKDGVEQHQVGIGSTTAALFDYAIEAHDGHIHMIGCNANAINTEPSPAFGGTFTNATEVALGESYPLTISLAYVGSTNADFSETDLSEIVTPAPDNWIQVTGNPSHVLNFDGVASTMPTLQAGYTYRFLIGDTIHADLSTSTGLHVDDILRFTTDGTTEYTTGITRVGNPNDLDTFGVHTAYVEFDVPSDVPPLQWYTDHNGIGSLNAIAISGSTYVVPVTGVTIEGPTANFTGNVINSGSNGWISLNEQLHAGERLVLDSAFLQDLNSALPDNCIFWVGLKDGSWSNTSSGTGAFKGSAAIRFYNTASATEPGLRMLGYANGGVSSQLYTASVANANAFIEITGSGNNIRLGYTASTSYNASSTTYGNWDGNLKAQTGEQGYGITAIDVVIFWQAIANNTVGFDISDVDFTGLTEINIPTPPVTNTTPWTKALDFSGSNEHTKQVASWIQVQPLQMGGLANLVDLGTTSQGDTSNHTSARPWATAVVFKSDGYSGTQMIWNQGEGSSNGDDNISLVLGGNGELSLQWGRQGTGVNKCRIAQNISSSNWYGISIAHNGVRLGGNNASASNVANCFNIRLMSSADSFVSISSNLSTSANWVQTGQRMDRTVAGDFTIGGRGSGYSFRGKVASMVVTTLLQGGYSSAQMPEGTMVGSNQAKMMITDPVKWVATYKVRLGSGNPNGLFRKSAERFATNYYTPQAAYQSTQVWLMGDGTSDSYSNGIRNYIYPSDQNSSKMQLNSMVSNDIENVNISGLS